MDAEDDDLFADLYGDDEPLKPTTMAKPAPAPAAAAPKAESGPPPANFTSAQQAPLKEMESVQQQPSIGVGMPDQNGANGGTENYWQQQNQGQPGFDNQYGSNQQLQQQQQSFGGINYEGGNNGYGGAQNQNYNTDGGNYAENNNNNRGHGFEHDNSANTGIKEDGKMFIGGLNWETTDASLKEYFSQFGEVTECTVMRDGPTGRSRGFGFLTFADPKTVNIVMVKEHYLDGKIIDPKRAIPRDEQEKTSKIFVGGVSQDASEQDFREYFMQFGRVLDATLMIDKDTGRPRGFGFVTFDSEQAVENALAEPDLRILEKPIEVKKAQPRGNIRDRHNDEDGGNNGNFRNNNFNNNNNRGGFNNRDGNNRFTDRNNGGSDGYNSNNNQGMNQGGAMGAGAVNPAYNGMTPQLMAQYWSRMQQYWAAMQLQAQMGRGRGDATGQPAMPMNPMMGMMGGMNPAMNPAMMGMMGSQMGMGMSGAGGGMPMQGMQQGPGGGAGGPGGFNSQGQMGGFAGAQQAQPNTPNAFPGQGSEQGGQFPQTSPPPQQAPPQGQNGGQWDGGMYEDNSSGQPQQGQPGQNAYNQQNRQQFQQQGQQGQQGQYRNASPVPNAPTGPRTAIGGPPPNAPTGPKSIRVVAPTGPSAGTGAYRGGGRGFVNRGNAAGGYNGRGFHPYARNNNNSNQNQNQGA